MTELVVNVGSTEVAVSINREHKPCIHADYTDRCQSNLQLEANNGPCAAGRAGWWKSG